MISGFLTLEHWLYLSALLVPVLGLTVFFLLRSNRFKSDSAQIGSRYRALVESFSDIIFILDKSGKYIEVIANKEILLVNKAEELLGKTIFEVMPAENAKEIFGIILKTFEEGPQVVEYKLAVPAGIRVFEGRTSILDDMNSFGEPTIVWASRDITEKVEVETRQRELEAQLVQAQKMEAIAVTAGGVAHDLNNLLSSIVVYPDFIKKHLPSDSKLIPYLDRIKHAGDQSAAIVKDLLILSRKSNRESKVILVNDLIAEFLESSVLDMLKDSSPTVRIQFDPGHQPMSVEGSSIHLTKVLMNLVINAFESISGAGSVTIRTFRDESNRVVIEVEDTGQGMSEELRKKIFDPFYSNKENMSSGAGLGLAVVWGIVQDHQGEILVESELGKGSCFRVELPIASDEARLSAPPLSQEVVSSPQPRAREYRVLVVDDFEDQREVLKDVLKELGHHVTTANSGEEAYKEIQSQSFDIVLLDMKLGKGWDGLDTYKKIVEIVPEQKVVIITGHSENARLKEAKSLGVLEIVTKPISYGCIKELVELISPGELKAPAESYADQP